MLSVLKRLLGHAVAERPVAPAGTLRLLPHRHHPGLIETLRDQHRELLQLFAGLETASERQDGVDFQAALERFARALNAHLAIENRYLYGFFARHGHPDADIAGRIDVMATDMMHVGRILQRFLAKYSRAPLQAGQFAQLRRDLGAVGEVLVHRIHEEESVLYPLYAPPTSGAEPAPLRTGKIEKR